MVRRGRPVAHTEAKYFPPPTIDPSLLARWSLKGGQSVENLRGLATAYAKPASRVRSEPSSASPQTTAHCPLPLRRRPTVGTHTHANRSKNLADKRPSDRRPQGSSEAVLQPVTTRLGRHPTNHCRPPVRLKIPSHCYPFHHHLYLHLRAPLRCASYHHQPQLASGTSTTWEKIGSAPISAAAEA
jgi:hypothetical protein